MGVKLVASSNGSVELVPANTASNFTVTVPAATTTMVGTDATQTLTNKTSTTFGVGNATPAASGAGITFPAAVSGSSDVNTLDDYEEGTWTPVVTSSGGSLTAYTSSGTYTKIGTAVTIQGRVTLTTVGTASGYANISGYPFVNSNNGSSQGVCRENTAGLTVFVVIQNNVSTGYLVGSSVGSITWTNNYIYYFNMTYLTT